MLEQEITVSVHIGSVSFAFKTNGAGPEVEDALKLIRGILSKHGRSLRQFGLIDVRTKSDSQFPKTGREPHPAQVSTLTLISIGIPTNVLEPLRSTIRKVSYWSVVLLLLYYSPEPLSYDGIMSLSGELGKRISYDWLNTEFHRRKYSGLVRSAPVPGSSERSYSLNEPGRKRAEVIIDELKGVH